VTETKAAVTDTHALIFHAEGTPTRLGRMARAHFAACERQEAIVYVPAAVVWESALLARRQRVDLQRSVRRFFEELFSNPAYQPLDLTPDQVYMADEAQPNENPFDALICAAARSLGLPLITRDAQIRESGLVKILW
jgi:PIN domain nuclease of toxin-antitoxin system